MITRKTTAKITPCLLRASVANYPKISDDNIAAIVQMADADGDNRISYEEYARFVK
jgi:hypothetical protein